MNKKQIILLLHLSYWIGIIADAISTIILLSPELAKFVFGLTNVNIGEEYLYVSRIAVSLMLGWTFLLFWADRKPIERRFILLLSIFPVVAGIIISGILAVNSKFISIQNILPLWIFNILIIIIYILSYFKAEKILKKNDFF
jgi:hypothetical protein